MGHGCSFDRLKRLRQDGCRARSRCATAGETESSLSNSAAYSALEGEARRTRSGLWGANTAPVPPWEWRKGQRPRLLAWLWKCLRNLFRWTD